MGSDFVWTDVDLDEPIGCKLVDFSKINVKTNEDHLIDVVVEYILHFYIDFSDNFVKRIDMKSIEFFKRFDSKETDVVLLSHLLRRNAGIPYENGFYYPENRLGN